MKNTLSTLTLILTSASTAFASSASEGSGTSLVTIAFLGFFALIVATQLIPGLALFVTGARSIFGKDSKHAGTNR